MAAESANSCALDQSPIDPRLENEALGPLTFEPPAVPDESDNHLGLRIHEGGAVETLSVLLFDTTFETNEDTLTKMIARIQKIHCDAFGSRIAGLEMTAGSTAATRTLKPLPLLSSILHGAARNAAIPPKIALLLRLKDGVLTTLNDIVLVTLLSTGVQTAEGRDLEIWSVCKNPASTQPNAFHSFLTTYHANFNKDKNGNPICTVFRLFVDSSNTPRMTEDARLRLYRYCGFQILPGSKVKLVYPSTEIWQVTESTGSYVKVRADNGQERCVYFAYCRAAPGTHIIMQATCASIQCVVPLDIQHVAGETNNALVDIRYALPYEPGINESGAREWFPMCAKYHQSVAVDAAGVTECVDVPENFIVVSFSSPGSLIFFNKEETDGLILELSKRTFEGDMNSYMKKLILENRSTATLPLTGLTAEEPFRNTFVSTKPRVGCQVEKERSFSGASVIQRMGKQPIMEIQRRYAKNTVHKYQIDVQVYTGGMKMLNTYLSRTTSDYLEPAELATKDAAWRKKQETDDNIMGMRLGFVGIKEGGAGAGAGAVYGFGKIDDRQFANQAESKRLSDLFAYLNDLIFVKRKIFDIQYPPGASPAQKSKIILYLYGCGSVSGTSTDVSKPDNYSLLYELSHRRSIVYDGGTFGPYTTGTSMHKTEFIDNFVLNKSLRGAVVCPPAGGGRKNRRSTRMATRFRKVRTRRVKRSKALKTRKQRGGDYGAKNYFHSLKASIVPELQELRESVVLPKVTLPKLPSFGKKPTSNLHSTFKSEKNPLFKPK
jgi:hypothetical protein